MAKRKSKKKPPPPRGSALARFLLTVGVAVLIIVVSGFLFVRTDGFRSYLRDTLEQSTGLVVSIGRSRVTVGGDLLFSDVHCQADTCDRIVERSQGADIAIGAGDRANLGDDSAGTVNHFFVVLDDDDFERQFVGIVGRLEEPIAASSIVSGSSRPAATSARARPDASSTRPLPIPRRV